MFLFSFATVGLKNSRVSIGIFVSWQNNAFDEGFGKDCKYLPQTGLLFKGCEFLITIFR